MRKSLAFLLTFLLVLASFQPMSEAASAKKAVVTSNYAKVYSGPGTKYKVFGKVYKGNSLTIYSVTKNNWSKVHFKNKTAYISNKNLKFIKNTSSSKNYKKYSGKWFTSANSKPGVGLNLKFISSNKAKINLYGIWWSMPDGSNARESDTKTYTITFDKNGVGKVKFIESFALNKGIATVKLSGNNVYLTVVYPKSYQENEYMESYIYDGKHKLVKRKF
ncbi:SH3 domain-containing protein [Neobacillus soli]|uniref:SH3 domain-containing protein n=1 Tax=Neobacillus soli TaxID=220688 RepID=UPI000826B049|nr:SH3 domain-containing protein [Neobacillus soli]